jgi:hypothetical protein
MRSKLVLAGLTATFSMAVLVHSASAGRLSVSSQNLRATYASLEFFGEGGIEATVRCPLTLEGSFHSRTVAKVVSSLVGYVTRAIVGSSAACTGGHATVLTATLPWHVAYSSFSGTLPNITSVRLLLKRVAFLLEVGLGTSCLYAEDGMTPVAGFVNREAGGRITGLTEDETIRLVKVSGTFGCPSQGGFRGTGSVMLLGATTPVTLTLI